MDKYNVRNGIIITAKQLTSSARKKIKELVSYNIQIFLEDEMAYDPTEHVFVPQHIVLSSNEQRDFLNRNNIDIDNLPIILTSDIIARYYAMRPGQVVKIIRNSLYQTIVPKSISFRAVKSDDNY